MTPLTSYFAIDWIDSRDTVTLLATYTKEGPEAAVVACLYYIPDEDSWGGATVNGVVATAFQLGEDGQPCTLVGNRGEVWAFGLSGTVKDQKVLPDSGLKGRHLGQPNDIKRVAGKLYVCGYAGQVYTQDASGHWIHIDDGIVEPEGTVGSIDLESIDGFGPNDLYVVGSGGIVAHSNGTRWSRIAVPTTVFLARVRCFAPGRIVAVGDRGTVLESDGKTWRASQIPGAEHANLTDVALFQDTLFVAAGDALFMKRVGAATWTRVQHDLAPEIAVFVRMTVGAGRLWTMGYHRLNSFDGKQWRTHVDDENG